jgi:hypothetical protein
MDSTIVGLSLVGAVLAYALITYSRTQAMRQREAEFFARHLRVGRRIDSRLRLLPEPW